MMLDASDLCKRQAHVAVHHARGGVRKTHCFRFESVHEDDAHSGERIIIEFTCRCLHQVSPGKDLLVERCSFFFEDIESHKAPLCWVGSEDTSPLRTSGIVLVCLCEWTVGDVRERFCTLLNRVIKCLRLGKFS